MGSSLGMEHQTRDRFTHLRVDVLPSQSFYGNLNYARRRRQAPHRFDVGGVAALLATLAVVSVISCCAFWIGYSEQSFLFTKRKLAEASKAKGGEGLSTGLDGLCEHGSAAPAAHSTCFQRPEEGLGGITATGGHRSLRAKWSSKLLTGRKGR